MTALENISNNTNPYNCPPQAEEGGGIVNPVPFEILAKALSYLDPIAIQSASSVSRFWNAAAIDSAKYKEFSEIKNFARFLGQNLQEKTYAKHTEQLFDIGRETKILNSVNLMQVKLSSHELKETISNILTGLEAEDLNTLEMKSRNKFCQIFFYDFFDKARIYKVLYREIFDANQLTVENQKAHKLRYISMTLAKMGNTDKALEVAMTISLKTKKSHALQDIAMKLLDTGNTDRAVEIAMMIPHKNIKGSVLRSISMKLVDTGNTDRALEVVEMLTVKNQKADELRYISMKLAEMGNTDKALEIVEMIPLKNIISYALQDIAMTLAKMGNTDRALEVVEMLTVERVKKWLRVTLCAKI